MKYKIARDSYKDEIIIHTFIVITFGLLVGSVIKLFIIERWKKVRK